MNNNENNDFTNIQPQDSNIGGSVPPIDQNINMEQQPVNPVPEMNPGMPQMEQPVNPVPEMNPGMPQMEQPVDPVPEMNSGMPQMEQPINPVPEMNPGMPQMNSNMGPVPPINTNINNQKPGFMSKYGKYIFIALAVIAIAAIAYLVIGGKKLTCTMNQSNLGIEMEANANFKFNGNKAKSVSIVMTIKFPEIYQSEMDSTVDRLKEQYKAAEEEGVKVDIKTNASTITVTVDAKNDNFSLIDVSSGSDMSYDAIKKSMETEGFTCK